jgi:hypothetical protein
VDRHRNDLPEIADKSPLVIDHFRALSSMCGGVTGSVAQPSTLVPANASFAAVEFSDPLGGGAYYQADGECS